MSDIETDASEVFIIPRLGESPILLQLKRAKEAIERISDIAALSPSLLPGLLTSLLQGLTELNKAMSTISLEIVNAEHKANRRKANLILDEMPRILIEKGIKSSEDVRNAILSLDHEYSQLCEQKDMLEAIFENLKVKSKNIEHALYSCKTITQYRTNTVLKGDDFTDAQFEPGQSVYRK